jgi:integrase
MSVRKKIVVTKSEPVTWWLADYFDGTGARHQRRFATKKEAAAHHDQIKTAIRAGQHVALSADLTITGAADKWLKKVDADGRERATLKMYREHVVRHIAPRIGNLKLAKMSKGHVEAFRDGLLTGDKALSRTLAAAVLVSLKSILKNAGVGHLGDHVRVEISKRHQEKPEVGRDIPTLAEVARLIKAAKPGKMRTLIMTTASTGLRASELRGLRWCDVDLKTGELHVRQRADRFNIIGPPKTDGSRRSVPIGPEVVHALKEWRLACPKCELDLAFPTSAGTVENHSNLLRSFEAVQVAAGVVDKAGKPKYGMHALRHFFASWCINRRTDGGRELPAKLVQTYLGHSSITMTLDVYGHLFPSNTDRAELAASEKALFG